MSCHVVRRSIGSAWCFMNRSLVLFLSRVNKHDEELLLMLFIRHIHAKVLKLGRDSRRVAWSAHAHVGWRTWSACKCLWKLAKTARMSLMMQQAMFRRRKPSKIKRRLVGRSMSWTRRKCTGFMRGFSTCTGTTSSGQEFHLKSWNLRVSNILQVPMLPTELHGCGWWTKKFCLSTWPAQPRLSVASLVSKPSLPRSRACRSSLWPILFGLDVIPKSSCTTGNLFLLWLSCCCHLADRWCRRSLRSRTKLDLWKKSRKVFVPTPLHFHKLNYTNWPRRIYHLFHRKPKDFCHRPSVLLWWVALLRRGWYQISFIIYIKKSVNSGEMVLSWCIYIQRKREMRCGFRISNT